MAVGANGDNNIYNDDDILMYMITIRKHRVKEYVSSDDLYDILRAVMMHNPHLGWMTEGLEAHGKYLQLHMHALFITNTPPLDKITSLFGFRIYWSEMDKDSDTSKIFDYIHKYDIDSYHREQIETDNWYRYHDGFSGGMASF